MKTRYDYRNQYKNLSIAQLKARKSKLWNRWESSLSQKDDEEIMRQITYIDRLIKRIDYENQKNKRRAMS